MQFNAFVNTSDDILIRLSSEITFLRGMVEQQRNELEKTKKEQEEIIGNLKQALEAKEAQEKYVRKLEFSLDWMQKVERNGNGYEFEGEKVADRSRGGEAESISGQRGSMDNRCGPYSDGRAAEAPAWDANINGRSR